MSRQLGRVWLIAALATVVVVGIAIVLVVRVRNATEAVATAEAAQEIARLGAAAGNALFALQSERGLAELWLATESDEAEQRYREAIVRTNGAFDAMRVAWNEYGADDLRSGPPGFDEVIDTIETLPELRSAASSANETSTFGAYTSVAELVFSATSGLETVVDDPRLAPVFAAYATLLRAGEVMARERGLITGKLGNAELVTRDESVQLLVLEQDARMNLAAAQALADGPVDAELRAIAFGDTSARIQEILRSVEETSPEDRGITAAEWFDASTGRISMVREVAAQVSSDFAARARRAESAARTSLFRSVVGLGTLLLVAVIVAFGAVLAGRDRARALAEHTKLSQGLLEWFLPGTFSDVPGLEVAARYAPASEYAKAGGDWYDVYPLTDELVAITIGDVVGHGPEASAHMAQLRNLLRGLTLSDPWVPSLQIDRLGPAAGNSQLMATLLHGLLDMREGTFTYTRAGHLPGLRRSRDGSVDRLEGALGPPVGVAGEAGYTSEVVRLEPGTVLALFTDGLVETRTRQLDVGIELAASILGNGVADTLDATADALLAARPDGGRHYDDAALLLVRWTPSQD